MRYRIHSSNGRRLVLRLSMPERPLIIVFLALVAFVCLLLALVYAVSSESSGDPFRALFFTGFGLFCFSGIFLFSGAYRRAFPSALVFDNDHGHLEIRDRTGTPIGTIPYAGIAGLSVSRTVDNRVTRHSVGVDLARGGRWELYAPQSRTKADAFVDTLRKAVTLSARPSSSDLQPPSADRLSVDRSVPGALRVAWRRKSHPVALVVSLLVLLSFLVTLVGTRPFAGGPGAWIAALAFAGFFLAAAVASILRTVGEQLEVRIGRGMLEYSRRSPLARPAGFALKLTRVASVDYSMSFSRIGTRIVVLQPQEVQQFVRYRQGTFGPTEVPGLVGFLRRLARIDVTALELDQRLALAELIREAVGTDRTKR